MTIALDGTRGSIQIVSLHDGSVIRRQCVQGIPVRAAGRRCRHRIIGGRRDDDLCL